MSDDLQPRPGYNKFENAFVIPPPSDVEAMAAFFDAHPDWSPMLNDDAVQIGVMTPWMSLNTFEDGA